MGVINLRSEKIGPVYNKVIQVYPNVGFILEEGP
jgi:hypothetical protein